MDFSQAESADIRFIRRQLNDLAVARSHYGWNRADERRYEELCELESALLCPL
jgi:hypothetical protein